MIALARLGPESINNVKENLLDLAFWARENIDSITG